MQKGIGRIMKVHKKVDICPKDKSIKPQSKKCKACEFFCDKRWYAFNKEVIVFCGFDMTSNEIEVLKTPHKFIKKSQKKLPKKIKK